jgi:ATP-dependent DNA ligase
MIITGFDNPSRDYTGQDFDGWPFWKNINGVDLPVTKYFYYNWIGAIQLSAYVDGKLTQICTSSGIDESLRKDMSENPEKYLNHVAKIGFMEKTEAGIPRHPKFIELHPDKAPGECTYSFAE